MKKLQKIDENELILQELFLTQKALFAARSVKKIKFFQRKLEYLRKLAKERGLI